MIQGMQDAGYRIQDTGAWASGWVGGWVPGARYVIEEAVVRLRLWPHAQAKVAVRAGQSRPRCVGAM